MYALGKLFYTNCFIVWLQFDPELVFVCAGFDSAIGDPEVNNISSFFHAVSFSDLFCSSLNFLRPEAHCHIPLDFTTAPSYYLVIKPVSIGVNTNFALIGTQRTG